MASPARDLVADSGDDGRTRIVFRLARPPSQLTRGAGKVQGQNLGRGLFWRTRNKLQERTQPNSCAPALPSVFSSSAKAGEADAVPDHAGAGSLFRRHCSGTFWRNSFIGRNLRRCGPHVAAGRRPDQREGAKVSACLLFLLHLQRGLP